MGDLEDGWNDWKRLLIEKRGSLAQHGLDNDTTERGEKDWEMGGKQRLSNLECKRFSH